MAYVANVVTRMYLRGAANVKQQADLVLAQLGYSADQIKAIRAQQGELNTQLITGLNLLNVVQLVRMEVTDVQKLATGKGGFSEMLSLGMSTILLIYRINALLKTKIELQMLSKSIQSAGEFMAAGGGLVGVAVLGAAVTAVTVGGSIAIGSWKAGMSAPDEATQQLRMQSYRSIVG